MKFLVLFILAISTLVTCIPALPKGIQTHSNAFALAAFSKALELGIDPAGQHPSDYIEDNGKVITFKAGSKFALWVAVQGARTDKAALEKRDSEMVITMWSNGDCTGDGGYIYNPDHGTYYYNPNSYDYSMQITQTVNPDIERIYLWGWNGRHNAVSDYCTFDYGWYVYGEPGCAPYLPPYSCYIFEWM